MTTEKQRFVLRNARALASSYAEQSLCAGDWAIDATMGNGGDTELLCRLVGAQGHVWGFDVQQEALRRTAERLTGAGLSDRATLLLAGHERMEAYVPGPVRFIMFNLGWLPGASHDVTTRVETSLAALQAGLRLLCPGGFVSLCIYPGHAEGRKELLVLQAYCAALPVREYNVLHHHFINASDDTPNLFLIQKNG